MPNINRTAGSGNFSQYGGGTAWGTSGSFQIVDSNAASHTLQSAKFSNLGFSIPSDATILGIRVQIAGLQYDGTMSNFASQIVVFKGATEYGATNYDWPNTNNSFVDRYFGNPTALWSTTWTPSDINASSFGFAMKHRGAQSNLTHAYQNFAVMVWYSFPGSTQIFSQSYINETRAHISGMSRVFVPQLPSTPEVGYGGGWGGAGGWGRGHGEAIYEAVGVVTSTIQGKASISKTLSSSVTGQSNIKKTLTSTLLGRASVRKTLTTTLLGQSNIRKTLSTTLLGRANIIKPVSTTLLGRANIYQRSSSDILGRSSIYGSSNATITGQSNIQKSISSDIFGKANIKVTTNTTLLGRASISQPATTNILGRANIQKPVSSTILGRGNIKKTLSTTILGRASISGGSSTSILGIASIRKSVSTTILGKASIASTQTSTILGRANILATASTELLGQAYVLNKYVSAGNYAPDYVTPGAINQAGSLDAGNYMKLTNALGVIGATDVVVLGWEDGYIVGGEDGYVLIPERQDRDINHFAKDNIANGQY